MVDEFYFRTSTFPVDDLPAFDELAAMIREDARLHTSRHSKLTGPVRAVVTTTLDRDAPDWTPIAVAAVAIDAVADLALEHPGQVTAVNACNKAGRKPKVTVRLTVIGNERWTPARTETAPAGEAAKAAL